MALTISLEHEVSIVTGASSGIGAAIAEAMADAGAAVLAVARDRKRLESVVGRIEDRGGTCRPIAVDVTQETAPEEILDQALQYFQRVDCLVHAAGIFTPKPIGESLEPFDAQWETNVRAPFRLTIAALPELRRTKGSIIFLSSIAGKIGFPNATAYCATKGAVELLVRSLAVEEAQNGVRVNAIAPGNVETPMNAHLMHDSDYLQAMLAATPLGRNGQVNEVAPLAVFLASREASSFMTGASVTVDGGWVAQ